MPPETKGKVIITAVAAAAAREKVVAFICKNGGTLTPDLVRAKLAQLPLVLAGSIEAPRGERLAAILNGMGATAVFEAAEVPVPPELPPALASGSAPPREGERSRLERPPGANRPAARGVRGKSAPPTAAEEQQRIALACRIVLLYALLACLVAMASPLFYCCSLPLALYASHRATALLGVSLWCRYVYLPGVFIPVLNLFLLALLLLRIHLFIRRSKIPATAVRDELASLRFVFRVGYAGIMAFFLFGTANGYLPATMHELRESVEQLLEKEVARSAKEFPRTVDRDLRIDSMAAGPGKRLTFNCTLLNYRARAVDVERLRTGVRGGIVTEACNSPQLRTYLQKEVIIAYAFSSSDNLQLATVEVSNTDCGN